MLFSLSKTSIALTILSLSTFGSTSVIQSRVKGGCGKSLPSDQVPGAAAATVSFKSTTANANRSYLIYVPENYAQQSSVPLILSYHGGGQDSDTQLRTDGFTNGFKDQTNNAIIVYPQALKTDGSRMWQGTPDVKSDDLTFTSEILNQLESTHCIDTTRIYATGKSQGGGFCGVLACDAELSSRIAAFAPVSGAFYVKDSSPCTSTQAQSIPIPCTPSSSRPKIPFLEFHGGTQDQTIPYSGGQGKADRDGCLPTIPHYIREWAKRDGLGISNRTTQFTSDTLLYEYGNDGNGGRGLVSHYFDSKIGHTWPRISKGATFDASPIILKWFQKYTL